MKIFTFTLEIASFMVVKPILSYLASIKKDGVTSVSKIDMAKALMGVRGRMLPESY